MADYDLRAYGRMLTEEPRMSAYAAAIRAAVRPGDTVLEIGTATGVMALLACQAGARRVYAIEPSESIVLAQRAARDNGMADRIVFHRALSSQVTLPERCDVLISDLRGSFPCFSTHLVDLMDARERLLQPNARWICQTDTLYVTVAAIANPADRVLRQWDGSNWGLNLSSALPYSVNQITRHRCDPVDLFAQGQAWASLHYPSLTSPHVRGRAELTIDRAGEAHGLQLWFTAALIAGDTFGNAPGTPAGVYAPMFLNWEQPVHLHCGDSVEVALDLVFSGHDYWWNWTTTIARPGSSAPLAQFKQSSFKGRVPDTEETKQASAAHQPALNLAGEETKFILDRIDGRASQGELAAALRQAFPNRFPNDAAALARFSQLRRGLTQ